MITKLGQTYINRSDRPKDGTGLGLGVAPQQRGLSNNDPSLYSAIRKPINPTKRERAFLRKYRLPNMSMPFRMRNEEKDDTPRLSNVGFGMTGGAVSATALGRLFTSNNKYLRGAAAGGALLGLLGTTKYRDLELSSMKKEAAEYGYYNHVMTKYAFDKEAIIGAVVKTVSAVGRKFLQNVGKHGVRSAATTAAKTTRHLMPKGLIQQGLTGWKNSAIGKSWGGKAMNAGFVGLGLHGGGSIGGVLTGHAGGMGGFALGGMGGKALATKLLPKTNFFGKKLLIGTSGLAGGIGGGIAGNAAFKPIGDKLVPIKLRNKQTGIVETRQINTSGGQNSVPEII